MAVLNRYFYFLMLCNSCRSYRIVVVFPMPGKSHAILGNSCVDLLLKAGHQVTYISWGPGYSVPHKNLTIIDITLSLPIEDRYNLRTSINRDVDLNDVHEFSMTIQRFPAVFGYPYIWLSSTEPHPLILGLVGGPSNPAYVPMIVFNNIPPFPFLDRIKSLRDQFPLYLYRELSYRIVVVFPMPGKSHAILGNSCVDLLLEAGHQVTYISWGPGFLVPHKNLTIIDITLPLPIEDRYNLRTSINRDVNLNDVHETSMIISNLQRKIFEHESIQKFLNDPNEHYDLAILEWLYGEYITGFPAVFGCPYIWLSSMEPHPLILGLVGGPSNPAYVPMIVFDNIPPFSFLDRIKSLRDQFSLYLYREFYIQSLEDKAYQEVIAPIIAKRGRIAPSYNDLRYNVSVILGNSHISVGKAIELPEAYKAIGGYHIKKNREPLPKDLEILMDNSIKGVIYFSLGSIIKSKDIPVEIKDQLLKVFGKLNHTVLWKFEADLPNRNENIHITSWAPQQSVLAHKNCILFITHGGKLSALEAVHFGVPLIGIPIFADQNINVKILAEKGMAKIINFSQNLAEDLKQAIKDILENQSYTQAAKHQSFIYHHRTVPPGSELVHWVEHVVKTNGAAHLRPISLIVPWYQKFYLDAALVAFILMIVLTVAGKWFLKYIKTISVKSLNFKKIQ